MLTLCNVKQSETFSSKYGSFIFIRFIYYKYLKQILKAFAMKIIGKSTEFPVKSNIYALQIDSQKKYTVWMSHEEFFIKIILSYPGKVWWVWNSEILMLQSYLI